MHRDSADSVQVEGSKESGFNENYCRCSYAVTVHPALKWVTQVLNNNFKPHKYVRIDWCALRIALIGALFGTAVATHFWPLLLFLL